MPPTFSALLIREHEYTTALGEVFLGPPGECVIDLKWHSGEPADDIALCILGELDEQLADWRSWPLLDDSDLTGVVRIQEIQTRFTN